MSDRDEIRKLVDAWRAEADEREARAANPEVVGMVERLTEEAAVRALRRCADGLDCVHVAEDDAPIGCRNEDCIRTGECWCKPGAPCCAGRG